MYSDKKYRCQSIGYTSFLMDARCTLGKQVRVHGPILAAGALYVGSELPVYDAQYSASETP